LEIVFEARELRQEAIHLLVLRLDENHEKKLLVPYVVLGDISTG
jgi:hypothetical protein